MRFSAGSSSVGGRMRMSTPSDGLHRPPGMRRGLSLTAKQAAARAKADYAAEKKRAALATRNEARANSEGPALSGTDFEEDGGETDVYHLQLQSEDYETSGAFGDEGVPEARSLQVTAMYEVYLARFGRRAPRSQRHRKQRIVHGFELQMPEIATSLENWEYFVHKEGVNAVYQVPEGTHIMSSYQIYVVDVFEERLVTVPFCAGDGTVAGTLVKQGLVPCTPYFATVAFTARTLNTFHALRMRCPRLGKQAFLRGLNDAHGIAPRPYLQVQFSTAYDLFLRAKEVIRLGLLKDLNRNIPNWRLKNGCPACFYKVVGQPVLNPPFLATEDGNNGLKRMERREHHTTEDGQKVVGPSTEALDTRVPPRDYYLLPEYVNRFAKDSAEVEQAVRDFIPDPRYTGKDNGCGEGWHNMKEHVVKLARSVYKETGIFAAFCRHSICLVICDMIQSGELAKYGLAATNHLLSVLGKFRLGYDIGCKFEEWVYTHPLVAPLAHKYGFEAIVGAFHGTGHRRLCQILNMPIYKEGHGLEPSENAENIFSKSNALAGTTRHASTFHRQQDIVEYFAHADNFDALANITSLFQSKYRRALEVLDQEEDLIKYMEAKSIPDRSVFEEWLSQEKSALEKLSHEPPEETLKMEYYQKLVDFYDADGKLQTIQSEEIHYVPPPGRPGYQEGMKKHQKQEAARRRALARRDRCATVVEDLEARRFRKALDKLQSSVVSRLLQLSKAHMAETEVGDMGVVQDFDLLRLAREDIRDADWAQPGSRAAMDLHFRLLRAEEERTRLNVEIKQFVTWMQDEHHFLVHHELRLEAEGKPAWALQVRKYRMLQGRFYGIHQERLRKLSLLEGFTGSIEPGVAVCGIRRAVMDPPRPPEMEEQDIEVAMQNSAVEEARQGGDDGGAGDLEDQDDEAETGQEFESVLAITEDVEMINEEFIIREEHEQQRQMVSQRIGEAGAAAGVHEQRDDEVGG
ncbi:hypothetical protein HMN09_01394700 [Mycena chlorophos]|uniref:CxC2-like cysteine cluster KDZ transposase-associated domain-containing protein n=1 Tax=Mycena chlorophos TaxID=658473 RepID=A0A8H6VNM4_MYCCL|nr:hypothetical protein HMN09_01394700 [Mycena chlorophos]